MLMLSADGKGIVMRPDALRAATAQARWPSATCREGDPAASNGCTGTRQRSWKAKLGSSPAAIRRKATRLALDHEQRTRADCAADYLLNKRP